MPFNNAHWGNRRISKHNTYSNTAREAGFDLASPRTFHRYVDSLRADLRERVTPWLAEQVESPTLANCMRAATIYDHDTDRS